MIYCWLCRISVSSVPWQKSQRQASKGFSAYRAKLVEMEARSHYCLKFVRY